MTWRPSAARIAVAAVITLVATLPQAAGAAPPRIDAKAAIVVEPATATVVYARNANQRRQIASTTKMMTALVTVEHASLDDVMTVVPYAALPVESVAGFRTGERVTVRDLLRALMITSANDAARTLAVRVAGSERSFVRMMNRRARALGLKNTHFENPVGLDSSRNYSTAADLVKIALVLRENRFLRELVAQPRVTLRSGDRPRTFVNRNTLVRTDRSVNGVKTGHTRTAGYILVGSATRRGVTVLSAVLGEPSEAARDRDTLALLRYGLDRFRRVTVMREGQRLASVRLRFRGDESVELLAGRTVALTVGPGSRPRLGITAVPRSVDGPLRAGAPVGEAIVLERRRIVARVPLVTARAVDAASFADRLMTWLARPLTLALIAVFALCSVYLLRVRRRAARRRATRRRPPEAPAS